VSVVDADSSTYPWLTDDNGVALDAQPLSEIATPRMPIQLRGRWLVMKQKNPATPG
jgi:hypothetical protein